MNCKDCDTNKIEKNINNNIDNQTINHQQNNIPNDNDQKLPKQKNKIIIIGLVVFGVIIISTIAFILFIFKIISDYSNKLECSSSQGNITIMYNEKEILGYKTFGMTYNLEKQKEYAKLVGIENYLEEFNNWFEKNTDGTCIKKGTQNSANTHDNKKMKTKNKDYKGEKIKVVGDKKYGYLTIPETWQSFNKEDKPNSLQYSYANLYIVTIDYIKEDTKYTAKDYAKNFLIKMKNNNEVTEVKGKKINIGKNKEYNAYQVYMYYKNTGKYLVTYWFKTEDGIIRYLSLEGPSELNDTNVTEYLYILENFSLNK